MLNMKVSRQQMLNVQLLDQLHTCRLIAPLKRKSRASKPVQAMPCYIINASTPSIRYERGSKAYQGEIVRTLLSQKLNFLALNMNNFELALSQTNELIGFGQLKQLGANQYELCSLYVDPAYRRQGVASTIITELLSRQPSSPVYLIAPTSRTPLYTRMGFTAISEDKAPSSLALELKIGRPLARLAIGEDLVVMMNQQR